MIVDHESRHHLSTMRAHFVPATFLAQGLLSQVAVMVAVACFSTAANAYAPDFDCSKPPPNNGVATMLCQNSEAAKHELQFDQVYYALRHVVGPSGWKPLRQEVILDQNTMNKGCNLPIPNEGDQSIPDSGATCYIAAIDRLATTLRARLSGAAQQEAGRDLDAHIALQRRLVDLGYLPSTTNADGVYGEATRAAIETWQRVAHRPDQSGFLSDADAAALFSKADAVSPEQKPAVAPQPAPVPPPANAAPAAPPANTATEEASRVAPPTVADRPKELTVDQAIADEDNLDGQKVIVDGTVQCINDTCDITQTGGMSSISFSRVGIDTDTMVQLLKCGGFETHCIGRLTGKIAHGDLGTSLELERIEFKSAPD